MPSGTIVRLNLGAGFGFIEPVGRGADVFFHESALHPSLEFDEQLKYRRVTYDMESTRRGPKAVRVRPL